MFIFNTPQQWLHVAISFFQISCMTEFERWQNFGIMHEYNVIILVLEESMNSLSSLSSWKMLRIKTLIPLHAESFKFLMTIFERVNRKVACQKMLLVWLERKSSALLFCCSKSLTRSLSSRCVTTMMGHDSDHVALMVRDYSLHVWLLKIKSKKAILQKWLVTFPPPLKSRNFWNKICF